LRDAATLVLTDKGIKNAVLNIVLLNAEDIKNMNNEYLQHNYATDVISFNLKDVNTDVKYDAILGEEDTDFDGEIYIGLDVAIGNAKNFKVSLTNELVRLSVHGTLHILGMNDETSEEKQLMTEGENYYLNELKNTQNKA
jgi:rRNA maturation RNase YbeY